MTRDELITLVTQELKKLSEKVETADYSNAVDDALRETGWAFDVTDNFQITWLKRRTKRHLFFMLQTEAASKFKFEQINSQMKFDHYAKLVKDEDDAFEKAKKEEPYKFAGVSAFQMFGTKIDAGFAYRNDGSDATYDSNNKVIITPSSSDS